MKIRTRAYFKVMVGKENIRFCPILNLFKSRFQRRRLPTALGALTQQYLTERIPPHHTKRLEPLVNCNDLIKIPWPLINNRCKRTRLRCNWKDCGYNAAFLRRMFANIKNVRKGIARGKGRKMRKKRNVTFGRFTRNGRLKTTTLVLGDSALHVARNLGDRTM
ncbi:uncharacterized protein PgNI_12183 [Pyricularia grisea]|uniref:Uncharacterized protein n=1 Tax=Pyricularia grisea TaxID=148305 RepID=A0A6P8AQW2_PYRGI|nr:uncharacterized protein PgNI_12183 [Pyricularia grisea]TLD04439.1 hypothetical protein PgNI_12183 [Pyricularia grisea]